MSNDDNIIDFEKAKTIDEKTELLMKQCDNFTHGFELVTLGLEKIRNTFKVMADELQKDRQEQVEDMEVRLIKSVVDAVKEDK